MGMSDPLVLETFACNHTVLLAVEKNLFNVIGEGDSVQVISTIQMIFLF